MMLSLHRELIGHFPCWGPVQCVGRHHLGLILTNTWGLSEGNLEAGLLPVADTDNTRDGLLKELEVLTAD